MPARDATTGLFTSGGGGGGGSTEVGRLLVRLMGDSSSYTAMFRGAVAQANRAMASIQRAGARIEAVGTKLKAMGTKLTIGVTAPLMLIGGMAVKSFASFDQAMTESTSIMQVTAKQTQQMRGQALELSTKATQGPTDLARAYFYLASAGLNAEQSMAALPQMAKFATAGAFDMALATDLVTDAQSALGLTVKDAAQNLKNLTRVTDVLVKANALANASVQQFSVAITSGAGAALKSFNKDIEEGTALLAAMADQGIKNELAGHNLARIMLLLSKASRDQAAEHKKLGFSVYDSAGKMRNFADIIQNLEDITRGMSDEVKSATLEQLGFEARIQHAILPIIGTSQAIRRYEAELRKAGGTTNDVANKQMQSFSNQMKVLKNRITLVAIEIGQRLAPIMGGLSSTLAVLIEGWKKLNPETKQAVVYWSLAAAALGPMLVGFGLTIKLIGLAVQGFALLRMVLVPLQLAMTAFALIFNPAGILLVGIGALVIIIGNMTGAWIALGESLKSVGQWFSDVFGPAIGEAKKAIGGIVDALKAGDFAGAAQIAMAGLKSVFLTAIDGLMQKWGGFVQQFGEVFLAVVKVIGDAWIDVQKNIARGLVLAWQKYDAFRQAVGLSPTIPDMTKSHVAETTQMNNEYNRINKQVEDLRQMYKIAKEAGNETLAGQISAEAAPLQSRLESLGKQISRRMTEGPPSAAQAMLDQIDADFQRKAGDWNKSLTDAISGAGKWGGSIHKAAVAAQKELSDVLGGREGLSQANAIVDWIKSGWEAVRGYLTQEYAAATKDLSKNPIDQKVNLEFSTGTQGMKWGSQEARAQLDAYIASRNVVNATKGAGAATSNQVGGNQAVPQGLGQQMAYGAGALYGKGMNYLTGLGGKGIRYLSSLMSPTSMPTVEGPTGSAWGKPTEGMDWGNRGGGSRVDMGKELLTRLDRLVQLGESQLTDGIKLQDLEPAGIGGGA